MPSISITKNFSKAVKSGEKNSHIIRHRTRPIVIGQKINRYDGFRSNRQELIKTVECKSVDRINIYEGLLVTKGEFLGEIYTFSTLTEEEKRELAHRNGFYNIHELIGFIIGTYGLPFEGVVIGW